MNNRKFQYFVESALRYWSDQSCPYCQNKIVSVSDRKFGVSRLLECSNCKLLFRHPKDRKNFNKRFYQDEYEETGITTNIPTKEDLAAMLKNNFRSSEKDYADKIAAIRSLMRGEAVRIVDYGSSWGYVSSQFKAAGFETQSFEISVPMAKKGNELLGLDIRSNQEELKTGNNVFFSSHVIEHLSDIRPLLDSAKTLLAGDGLFMAFSPNGSSAYRKMNPGIFHSLWGMVHPNFLNEAFYKFIFKEHPYIITSSPYNRLSLFEQWDRRSQVVDETGGEELLVVALINEHK